MPKIPLAEIKVGQRMRTDYGDLADLMESMQELGQIQAITISQHGDLIAGGRRYEAARRLGWHNIEAIVRIINDDSDLRELELEENLRRKDMHWSEQARTIYEIYNIRKLRAVKAGQKWTFRQCGDLVGSHFSYVNNIVRVVEAAKDDPSIFNESNLQSAIQRMLKHEADKVAAHLARMQRKHVADEIIADAEKNKHKIKLHLVQYDGTEVPDDDNDDLDPPEEIVDGPLTLTPERPPLTLADVCVLGDSIEWLTNNPMRVDHILTDIPYGIDMDALDTIDNIERTKAEHDVEENISLMKRFLPAAFLSMREKGWLVFFFDLDHFDLLKTLARDAGFNVQRWPLIMHKTSGGKNSAAGVNFTKDYEAIFVARKAGAVLSESQASSVLSVSYTQIERRVFAHPFSKPRQVCQKLVSAISHPGQIVCDPFAGEGSIALSVLSAGRIPLAIEKMPVHYNLMCTHFLNALNGNDPVAATRINFGPTKISSLL